MTTLVRWAVFVSLAAAAWTVAGCASLTLGIANGADRLGGGYVRAADLAYGEDPRQRVDVYTPAQRPMEPAPLVVFVHGGRWSSGSKDLYRFAAAGLAERGCVVVVPSYRLYPAVRMPATVDDVARAVAWAQRAASEYHADPRRLTLVGHSAGAQLAALVAFDRRYLAAAGAGAVHGFAGFAGPYDFLPLTDADLIDYFGPPARFPESQPVNYVSDAAPPAFLVHGLADTTVKPRNALALAARLEAANVPVELHLPDGEDHAGVLRRFARFFRGEDALYAEFVGFIRRPLAASPAAVGPIIDSP